MTEQWVLHSNPNCRPVEVRDCGTSIGFSGGGWMTGAGCITVNGQIPKIGDVLDWNISGSSSQSWNKTFIVRVEKECRAPSLSQLVCTDYQSITPSGLYGGCPGGCTPQLWNSTIGSVIPQGDAIVGCKNNNQTGPLGSDNPLTIDPQSKITQPGDEFGTGDIEPIGGEDDEIIRMQKLANIR